MKNLRGLFLSALIVFLPYSMLYAEVVSPRFPMCNGMNIIDEHACILAVALRDKQVAWVQRMLSMNSPYLDVKNDTSACGHGYLYCIASSYHGETDTATVSAFETIVELLLTAGADPNLTIKNYIPRQPYYNVAKKFLWTGEMKNVVQSLVNHGLKPGLTDNPPTGRNLLQWHTISDCWLDGGLFPILWSATPAVDKSHVNNSRQHIGHYVAYAEPPVKYNSTTANTTVRQKCLDNADLVFTERPDLLTKPDAFGLNPIDYTVIYQASPTTCMPYSPIAAVPYKQGATKLALQNKLLAMGSPPPKSPSAAGLRCGYFGNNLL